MEDNPFGLTTEELIDCLREDLEEERKIVNRIWALLGNPSYAELKGRSIYDLIQEIQTENETLKEAINKIWEVASGESQVAMDDTAGMEWISDYTSSLWDNDEILTERVEGE